MGDKRKVTKGYFHTNEDKSRAVAAYVSLGSFKDASSVTGIPENTIRNWAKQDWFAEEARRVDREDSEQLKNVFTKIAKKATSELMDRLERGDDVVTKDGDVIQKRIGGKDLAIIAAVAADKRKQQLDSPQTVAVQSTQEKLINLMEAFMKFASAKEIRQEAVNEKVLDVVEESIREEQSGRSSSEPSDAGEGSGDSTSVYNIPSTGAEGTGST